VEGAVVEEATAVLRDGRPKLLSYGIADELAATVGLTCGGTIRVWVERMDRSADVRRIAAALDEQRPLAVVTQLTGAGACDWVYAEPGRVDGRLRSARLTERVTQDALGMLAVGATGVRHYGPDGEARQDEVEVFVWARLPADYGINGPTSIEPALDPCVGKDAHHADNIGGLHPGALHRL